MNILQYNILDGCRTEERYTEFSNWLTKQDYDIVGFNELNNWTEIEFQDAMKQCGFTYSCLFEMESSPYFIGITAKFPIERVNFIEEDPFYHGLLHVKIKDIHFIIVHLTSFESTYRERETARIAEYITSITEPVIVMGDLNTLSPLDQDHYNKENTLENLATKEHLVRQHIVDEAINYRPMQILLDAGLHDVGFSESFDHSMPTNIKRKTAHPIYLRLDYILVNSTMLNYNPLAKIIRNSEVEMLSDHYPIECHWKDTIL